MNKIHELYYSKVTDDQISAFIDAWEDTFERKLSQDTYNWLFHKPNNLYAIFANDKIVAGYCLIDYHIVFKNQKVEGALCNNVFVRPSYQGNNLFVKLGRYALTESQSKGIKIAIGIPNQNAVPGHKRVGWTSQDKIYFLEKHHLKIIYYLFCLG